MIQIGDCIVSLDLLKEHFCCDIEACKGVCCEDGDCGAPLTIEEKLLIEKDLDYIKPYMTAEGRAEVEKNGVSYNDIEGDLVTALVNNKECAFAIKKDGIWQCTIEQAYNNGEASLRKPESCWLYPVRITPHRKFVAVEYHKWDICKSACQKGCNINLPLYKFLRQPLIAKFGVKWYEELEFTAEEYNKWAKEMSK